MTQKIHNHLLKLSTAHCKPLASIIKANGPINIEIPTDIELFDCLAQTDVEQQLSYKAAKSIWNKIKTITNNRFNTCWFFSICFERIITKKINYF